MRNIAFIPVRGGSKSIHMKNIKSIAGKPLVWWTASAASECDKIETVYVATDSDEIKETVERLQIPKVRVVSRSEENASDKATTEAAMLEFANKYEFDNIVLIQATSPLLKATDLSAAFEVFGRDGIDSVLSVVRQKRFIWKEIENGVVCPANYETSKRPRRQEFDGFLVENGAFYITSRTALMETKSRISGNIGFYEMPSETYHEIDEPQDWAMVEHLLLTRIRKEQRKLDFSGIKLFLTDCDGVLTDGGMYYSEGGDELKKFHTRDGYALQCLKNSGIITGIITGEDRLLNERRAEKVHVDEIIQGVTNKAEAICDLCDKYNCTPKEVMYVGDDINDVDALIMAGIGCCPADAVVEVKKVSDMIMSTAGGRGVIREIVDYMLKFSSETINFL